MTPIKKACLAFIDAAAVTPRDDVFLELGMLTMGAFMTFGERTKGETILKNFEAHAAMTRLALEAAIKERNGGK